MPILKNAKKKVKNIRKKSKVNNVYYESMRTAIKDLNKVIVAGDAKTAKEKLNVAITKIDKAQKKGLIKANKAARHKSKLTKNVNAMK